VTARGMVIVRVAVRVSVGSLCRHALGGATSLAVVVSRAMEPSER
jgi:hypothetical protein